MDLKWNGPNVITKISGKGLYSLKIRWCWSSHLQGEWVKDSHSELPTFSTGDQPLPLSLCRQGSNSHYHFTRKTRCATNMSVQEKGFSLPCMHVILEESVSTPVKSKNRFTVLLLWLQQRISTYTVSSMLIGCTFIASTGNHMMVD